VRRKRSRWSVYRFGRGALEILLGDRKVVIPVKRGMTFYELERAREKITAVTEEIRTKRRDRNQIDLEEAIARKAKEPA
jgi:hypothetical protein